MGGVAGHLAHLYDNRDLTYNKMAEILRAAASGELIGTEKTDGYNIYLGFANGRARAARNKGDMQRGGMSAEDLINRTFQGGESAKKAYVIAFRAYEKAMESLSDEERANIFGANGEVFYNAEIQGPLATNVVNYDRNILTIHRMGHKKYNPETNQLEIVDTTSQPQYLDNVLDKFEEATSDEPFNVQRTAFLTLNKITDESFVQTILNKIQETGYSGDMTIHDYLENKLRPVVEENFKDLDKNRKQLLIDRILEKEGAWSLTQITKGFPREEKQKISEYVKNSKLIIKNLIKPIEMAIHEFAVELLKGLRSAYILDSEHNKKEVARLKLETEEAINAIQSYRGPEYEQARDILVQQLLKLKHHSNIDTVVEGFAFQHDGQMYKFTGNFAPMNQLLGLFKYGRGKIPKMSKTSNLDQKESNTVAILPGKFKPPHRGHLDMIKHYANIADRVVVLISPKEKDGITPDISKKILDLYVQDSGLPNVDIEIADYNSPVRAAIEYGNNPEMAGTRIILGASTKNSDAAERFSNDMQQYVEDAKVLNPLDYAFDPVGEVLSATDFRNALRNNKDIQRFLPEASIDRANVISDMVKEKLQEVAQYSLGIFLRLIHELKDELGETTAMGGGAVAIASRGASADNKEDLEESEDDLLEEDEIFTEFMDYLYQSLGEQ
tara:strand:+ start:2965 stop:4971 length:2007 start_codon:yes stop_codon:yes gene_type:complete